MRRPKISGIQQPRTWDMYPAASSAALQKAKRERIYDCARVQQPTSTIVGTQSRGALDPGFRMTGKDVHGWGTLHDLHRVEYYCEKRAKHRGTLVTAAVAGGRNCRCNHPAGPVAQFVFRRQGCSFIRRSGYGRRVGDDMTAGGAFLRRSRPECLTCWRMYQFFL